MVVAVAMMMIVLVMIVVWGVGGGHELVKFRRN